MDTYASALARVGVTVPDHLESDAAVPVLTGPQAQGDLLILPLPPDEVVPFAAWEPLAAEGAMVVHGEATGNTHWLHAGFDSPDVRWFRQAKSLTCGYVSVPEGQSALLIHTDEHGANGIGPGRYEIRRKRELGFGASRGPRFVLD